VPKSLLNKKDCIDLKKLIEGYENQAPLNISIRKYVLALRKKLEQANIVEFHIFLTDVVLMNSVIRYRDLLSKEDKQYMLVYPQRANEATGRISILSALGVALLGRRKGDVIEAEMANESHRIEILDIQPSYIPWLD
jgi:regulator of nucleoside diphosphate kinase